MSAGNSEAWRRFPYKSGVGCISANGVGDLVRINGVLDAEEYSQIVSHHAIPSGKCVIGPKFTLQQDNDPKHTANVIENYLQRKEEQKESWE